MTNTYTSMNLNIANDIKKIQNLCRGTKKHFFELWQESGMDFNDFGRVLMIMVDAQMITRHGETIDEEAYSY